MSNTVLESKISTNDKELSILFLMCSFNKYMLFVVDNINELIHSKDDEIDRYLKLEERYVPLVLDWDKLKDLSLSFSETKINVYLFTYNCDFKFNSNSRCFESISC